MLLFENSRWSTKFKGAISNLVMQLLTISGKSSMEIPVKDLKHVKNYNEKDDLLFNWTRRG